MIHKSLIIIHLSMTSLHPASSSNSSSGNARTAKQSRQGTAWSTSCDACAPSCRLVTITRAACSYPAFTRPQLPAGSYVVVVVAVSSCRSCPVSRRVRRDRRCVCQPASCVRAQNASSRDATALLATQTALWHLLQSLKP